jgi:hypothetical protein
VVEGDPAFIRLDARRDPALLERGSLAEHVNGRIRDGVAETRLGCIDPIWARIGHEQIFGTGVFSNPLGEEWGLLVVRNRVWAIREGVGPKAVPLPEGVIVDGPVSLVQCFNVVVLFRGADLAPLVWLGSFLSGFVPISASPTPPLIPIPNAEAGEFFANRLLVPFQDDTVAVSDIGDYTVYDPTFQEFWINTGGADRLVRIFGWNQGRVVMFKEKSVLVVENVAGDLSQARLTEVSRVVGCVGRLACCQSGGDVMFLDRKGVYALSEVFESGLKVAPAAVSDPVAPLLERVNWRAAAGAVMVAWREYIYVAVPMDGAVRNNGVLVFNTRTLAWESLDVREGLFFDEFFVLTVNGDARLFGVDKLAGRVLLLEEGEEDIYEDVRRAIPWRAVTRGYRLEPVGQGEAKRITVELETWFPELDMAVRVDGVAEESVLVEGQTRSRVKYVNWGKPDWNPLNEDDDHGERGREDYGVVLPEPDGMELGSGVVLNLRQAWRTRWPVRVRGERVQMVLENNVGVMRLKGVAVEGVAGERSPKVQLGG